MGALPGGQWICDECGRRFDTQRWLRVWPEKDFCLCMGCLVDNGFDELGQAFIGFVETSAYRHKAQNAAAPQKDKIPASIRRQVIERDGFHCRYCGEVVDSPIMEHLMPESRGGLITVDNLVVACVRCNSRKGTRTPEEAGMVLLPPRGLGA